MESINWHASFLLITNLSVTYILLLLLHEMGHFCKIFKKFGIQSCLTRDHEKQLLAFTTSLPPQSRSDALAALYRVPDSLSFCNVILMNVLELKFTSGKRASLEHNFAISSWMMDSMLVFPNPKSFKFLSRNLLCSLQYFPEVAMTPGAQPSLSFPTVCQPGLVSLIGCSGARAETSSRLYSSEKLFWYQSFLWFFRGFWAIF